MSRSKKKIDRINRISTGLNRTGLILIFSLTLVVIVTWFAPSLSAASLNLLFRLRGELKTPDDIVILAIDDQSLQRIGHWPWPRSVMAGALDQLSQAQAGSIGLDVVYAEPTTVEEDRRLAEAIERSGRVVLPAQLFEANSNGNPSTFWLRPRPEFSVVARALGHAHVSPEVDGMVRSIQLSKTDDQAGRLWAFSVEVIRAADRIAADDLAEEPGTLRLGKYRIPVRDESAGSTLPGVTIIRQNEMAINYAGPAGTFRYYSLADLLEGKIPASVFSGKIVLIGATAETMGDTRVVPFIHYRASRSEGGQEMPGVEIHANIINTIRRNLSLRHLPDWQILSAAILIILLCTLAVKRFDGFRQILALGVILIAIIAGSLFAFGRYLIVPPLAPMLTGFLVVIPLLLNRALANSRELDIKLAALVGSQRGFLPDDRRSELITDQAAFRTDLPRSLAWKLQAVDDLTTRLVARMSFINRVLSSMGEGVLVSELSGRIVFANREATRLFGFQESELIGESFIELLADGGIVDRNGLREAIKDVAGGKTSQFEFELPSAEPRYYSILLSALGSRNETIAESGDADLLPASEAIGFVALISDITKRVELDRIKTETLQLVSHELRTPLTSIQGLSDVLIKFPVAVDQANEMLSMIHSEAARLSETINRYLDLTRLESGVRSLNLSPVSCPKLIAECTRNLSVMAAGRGIEINSQIDPTVSIIKADAQLLTQAVNNLLSNAIKYSPPGTEVIVGAERDQKSVRISVRDQGFGIPEESREKIFEKFYRLDRDSSSQVVGTGLGLPLVKEIVEQHGGRITLECIPSHGSTFTIHLPTVDFRDMAHES